MIDNVLYDNTIYIYSRLYFLYVMYKQWASCGVCF